MQAFISAVLAFIMTVSSATGLLSFRDNMLQTAVMHSEAEEPDTEPLEPAAETAAADGLAWEDMEYSHYDPEAFYALVDELTDLASGDDTETVIEVYDQIYDECVQISTLQSIAYIQSSIDVNDDYWSDESLYCDTLAVDMADAACTAIYAVTQGPCADGFKAHVGDDAMAYFESYIPMTDREMELVERESELVDEYYSIMDGAYDVTYTYLGESWDWDMLNGFQGSNLAYTDYDGYLEVYYGLQEAVNAQVGPIFTELVQIRAEYAEIEGYDTYSDLAYEQAFGRDYTTEDAQAFCDQVKSFAASYYEDLYYSDLWSSYDAVSPIRDGDELVELLGQYVEKIDPIFVAPWQSLSGRGLYDLAAGSGRMGGAFTIDLSAYDCAFIYAGLSEDCYDFGTLSHEFGHFTDSYYNKAPNLLSSIGSYDLLEIHSTGLEALCTEFYDEVYDEGADIARFITLGAMVESVLDGCIHDEFQRRIYAQPDMTLDEINRLFADVCAEYGQYEPSDVDYSWMFVMHDFESPLYYISYATSALAAIQIWDKAQTDFQSGVDAYKAVLERGAYEDGYLTVLADCGLRLFNEEGAVEDICAPLISYLEELNESA